MEKGNKAFSAKASQEIIVSAGAFQSPQLLMVSGIGDPEELKTQKINCIHDVDRGRKKFTRPFILSYLKCGQRTSWN